MQNTILKFTKLQSEPSSNVAVRFLKNGALSKYVMAKLNTLWVKGGYKNIVT